MLLVPDTLHTAHCTGLYFVINYIKKISLTDHNYSLQSAVAADVVKLYINPLNTKRRLL